MSIMSRCSKLAGTIPVLVLHSLIPCEKGGFVSVRDFLAAKPPRDAADQRCLVVTDGFYEWKKLDAKGKLKRPHAIAMAGDTQMVMAGLWAKWKSPASGEEVLSCTILTCEPNNAMGELHDRMPVILAENDWPRWLGEEPASEQDLLALLRPCPDEALKIWPVDKMVGNVRNNGPQLILPVLSNALTA